MHLTEFNTSYSPLNPLHDTNLNAAYIANLLSKLGDTCASYSYWTFGDVFEEAGVAFTPFSGCFGLLANGLIPKPTYWTFVFYKNLYETALVRNENFLITKAASGDLRGIAWNIVDGKPEKTLDLALEIKDLENSCYLLLLKTVDEIVCNPLKVWLDMGSPANPSVRQKEILRESAQPLLTTKQLEIKNGIAAFDLHLTANAVIYLELQRVYPETDRGFQPERIRGA
jgi:xylan 1,4-beta-xylosidase